eukprot:GILK01005135.1.p1 GENE.GILK01005135.1~~GILK01005135.1.p1  ORF type:complete len:297 (+),score=10.29 GILK01005135.1:43-933(+)
MEVADSTREMLRLPCETFMEIASFLTTKDKLTSMSALSVSISTWTDDSISFLSLLGHHLLTIAKCSTSRFWCRFRNLRGLELIFPESIDCEHLLSSITLSGCSLLSELALSSLDPCNKDAFASFLNRERLALSRLRMLHLDVLSLPAAVMSAVAMGVKCLQRLTFSDCTNMDGLLNVDCISNLSSCPLQELNVARCYTASTTRNDSDVIPQFLTLLLSAQVVKVHTIPRIFLHASYLDRCLRSLVSLLPSFQPREHIASTLLVFSDHGDYSKQEVENLLKALISHGFNIVLESPFK